MKKKKKNKKRFNTVEHEKKVRRKNEPNFASSSINDLGFCAPLVKLEPLSQGKSSQTMNPNLLKKRKGDS